MNRYLKSILLCVFFIVNINNVRSQIFSIKDTDYDMLTEDLQTLYNYAERAKNNIEPYKSYETDHLVHSDFTKSDRNSIIYEVTVRDNNIFDFLPDVMQKKLKLNFVRDEVNRKESSLTMIYRDCKDGLKITVTHFKNTKRMFVSVQWFDKKIRHRIMELHDCQN